MKAIETEYKGYLFRSRLEARWAVFFDVLGIKWEYESEGYERDDGDGNIRRYLPDFKIGNLKENLFVEVKGDPDWLKNNAEDFVNLHDWDGILPNFHESYGTNNGLLLLGNIPEPRESILYLHPLFQHHEGLIRRWAMFVPGSIFILEGIHSNPFYCLSGVPDEIIESGDGEALSTEPEAIRTWYGGYYPRVYEAYLSARQAKFEFKRNKK